MSVDVLTTVSLDFLATVSLDFLATVSLGAATAPLLQCCSALLQCCSALLQRLCYSVLRRAKSNARADLVSLVSIFNPHINAWPIASIDIPIE
ncbi:hypothetical protein F2Q69_00021919 [Brassica cretica]|uniref:Uncharacterized protein n=1 Tax=Brassica cretica TaxID=69181 RepID=A0A8S9QG80_BRACR|nr:hypothetical protein F2Q69_00021919 [Brassica cretica]